MMLALTIASAALLAGCTSPRNSLGTTDSRCFKVLPEARLAVRGRGRFSGVRYVTLDAQGYRSGSMNETLSASDILSAFR